MLWFTFYSAHTYILQIQTIRYLILQRGILLLLAISHVFLLLCKLELPTNCHTSLKYFAFLHYTRICIPIHKGMREEHASVHDFCKKEIKTLFCNIYKNYIPSQIHYLHFFSLFFRYSINQSFLHII